MKKKLLIYVSIGLLIILSAIVFLRISQNTPKPIPKADFKAVDQALDNQDSGQISQVKAREIASSIIKWLDGMKNDVGRYYVSESCKNDECSKSSITNKQIGINVVWARYRNYLNTRDESELKQLEKDLTTLTTPEVGFPAQNDSLNCRLMFEMSNSGIFKEESKNKIDKICHGSIHYGSEMDEFIKNKRLYRMEPRINEVIRGQSLEIENIANRDRFIKYAIYASDIAYYYQWVKNPDDLAAAKFFFNLALQIYSNDISNTSDGIIALASWDLYKITQDNNYKEFADFIYKNKKNESCRSLTDCSYYLMFLREYSKEYKSRDISQEIENTVNYLLNKNYSQKLGIFGIKEIELYPVLDNAIIAAQLTDIFQE